MQAGDTFYLQHQAADGHLWVIISDPEQNPARVLFVSMTSYDIDKEDVCLIQAGEHPRVTHKTCINYQLTRHRSYAVGRILYRGFERYVRIASRTIWAFASYQLTPVV